MNFYATLWRCGLACLAVAAPTLPAQTVQVGPNVHVSAALPHDPHFEMLMAADPVHPERMVACSMLMAKDFNSSEVITYVTFDHGQSWRPTLRVRARGNRPSWDPACAYGPNGILYSISENMDSAATGAYDQIDRSTDGGRTWDSTPAHIQHGERTFFSIDQTDGPHRGWLYLYGQGGLCLPGVKCKNSSAAFFHTSEDGGRTVAHEQRIPASGNEYIMSTGQGAVLSDGTLVAPIGNFFTVEPGGSDEPQWQLPVLTFGFQTSRPTGVVRAFISKPGKPNFMPDTRVVKVSDWYIRRDMNGSAIPMMAADATKGPFQDRIYAIWADQRSGRSQIYLSTSSDKGSTWSAPRTVNDDWAWPPHDSSFSASAEGSGAGIRPDAIQGEVAVNKDGVVGVMWFDRRDHPDNLGYTVRFRASFDGGETFTPSVVVSKIPYDLANTEPMPLGEIGGWDGVNETIDLGVHNFHYNAGHTVGFTADADGVFHALWVGNSTHVPQLWTAPISVTGKVYRNGSPALDSLKDVTSKIRFELTQRTWTRETGIVSADVVLENDSRDTIRAPLMVRLRTLQSDIGEVRVLDADAGGSAEGAVWNLSALVDGGVLLPGQRTRAKHVRFHLTPRTPFRPHTTSVITSAARFDPKVLAGQVTGPTAHAPPPPFRAGNNPKGEVLEDEH